MLTLSKSSFCKILLQLYIDTRVLKKKGDIDMTILNLHPLVLDKELAVVLGLNEALILQQVHYWIEINKKNNRNFHEGRYWTYNTIDEWHEEFPFWSNSTIKRTFKRLRDMNLIIVDNFNVYQMDRTLWYTINYEELEKMIKDEENDATLDKNDTMIGSKGDDNDIQNEPMERTNMNSPLPEITTKTSTEISNQSIYHEKLLKDDRGIDGRNPSYEDFQERYKKIIKNCELHAIDEKYQVAADHAIKLLLLDIENSKRIKIGDNYIPAKIAENDVKRLNFFAIEHAVNKFKEASRMREIRNPIGYLKVLIYNSISEMDIDVDSKLRYADLI
ncbi:hypothetical protein SAMN02745180_00253 [Sporanaerobacter acetigenes DSM 13106]|uniref:Uncharacterized protein n=2 Tax=Sporanaerobacter acetigenes TaxID=165813 RepID=A0A1M5SRR3_9FIRM|nr:hypothetical protein SAMN02745180_00253 [Sporanaerobacter acetigenes DSM 13106]